MKISVLARARRRAALAYQLRCAREDARRRNIRTPLGVWACADCAHVSLNLPSFKNHTRVHV